MSRVKHNVMNSVKVVAEGLLVGLQDDVVSPIEESAVCRFSAVFFQISDFKNRTVFWPNICIAIDAMSRRMYSNRQNIGRYKARIHLGNLWFPDEDQKKWV